MTEQFRKEWCDALRSGDFKQGRLYLKRIEDSKLRFCCIGVACELLKIPSYQEEWVFAFPTESGERLHGNPDRTMRHKLGFSSRTQDILVGMNDDKNTFAEIADWLESQPLETL